LRSFAGYQVSISAVFLIDSFTSVCIIHDKPQAAAAAAAGAEVGHNMGLSHDGTTLNVTYYKGHGDWAPVSLQCLHCNAMRVPAAVQLVRYEPWSISAMHYVYVRTQQRHPATAQRNLFDIRTQQRIMAWCVVQLLCMAPNQIRGAAAGTYDAISANNCTIIVICMHTD
jgi:hypothetical protein